MKTRAAVLLAANAPLLVTDVELAPPCSHEVLVRIEATSLCRSDLNGIRDPGEAVPVILGHEGAGVVVEVGPEVTHVAQGDRVVLSWLPYCEKCYYCDRGTPQLCDTVQKPLWEGTLLDGTTRFSVAGKPIYHYSLLSTFSEYTVVPGRSCVPLPEGIPLDRACLLGCAVATGWGAAVSAAGVGPGSATAVLGVGGVGLAALQGARHAGAARIIAIDRKAVNLERTGRFGATHTILLQEPGAATRELLELTEGRGPDFIIDTTGNVAASRLAVQWARRGGVVVLVGAYHDPDLCLVAPGFHRTGKTVKASFYGDMDPIGGLRQLADLYVAGGLQLDELIQERIGLEQINEAFLTFDDPARSNAGRTVVVFR